MSAINGFSHVGLNALASVASGRRKRSLREMRSESTEESEVIFNPLQSPQQPPLSTLVDRVTALENRMEEIVQNQEKILQQLLVLQSPSFLVQNTLSPTLTSPQTPLSPSSFTSPLPSPSLFHLILKPFMRRESSISKGDKIH